MIKEKDETLSFIRRGGPWFLEIRGHAALHGPWTKLEAYMPLTVQTFLGVLQTIPVSNESIARLSNAFTSSEEKLTSLVWNLS